MDTSHTRLDQLKAWVLRAAPLTLFVGLLACGREPSGLLRQGQLPIFDFPMYMSQGVTGKVLKVQRDRTSTDLVTGLNDPRGVATDRFNNLYVAEYGANRVIKVNPEDGSVTELRGNLQNVSMVAVDGFGEVYAAVDSSKSIVCISDGATIASFSSLPSAMVFGVDDELIIALYSDNKIVWNRSGNSATINHPVALSVDNTGRVYATDGALTAGSIHRYHQKEGEGDTIIALGLQGPLGSAVDPAGNLFIAEQGAGRMVLVRPDGAYSAWITGLKDIQYLVFTQY